MKTEVMIYEGNEIEFTLDKNEKMMVNATEMAKVFDRDLFQFTKSEHCRAFINSCQKPAFAGLLGIENENDLIVSKQRSGTWMHRVLALKFAAWLNPVFEVWVYSTIEGLLFGRHVNRNRSLERTLSLQSELEMLRFKFGKTGDDFERFLEIERELKREKAYRRALTVETINGMDTKLPF